MDFTYESQGTNTYLVYAIRDDDVVDSMSLGMLTNNKIPGLAQALFMQMDSEKFIKYNVTSKISVRQFLSGTVSRKRLLGIFSGITEGLLAAEDYMIDENSILLDLNYIFADVSTCKTRLICWPICNTELRQNDLKAFFKNIMVNTQFDATENSDYIAKIFNFLNSASVFSLAEFKKLLDELKNERTGAYTLAEPQPEVRPQGQKQPEVRQPEQRQAQPRQPQQSAAAPVKPEPVKQNIARPTPSASGQMAIPPAVKPVPTVPQKGQQGQKTEQKPEKPMSMWNLLMHYSAENKKLYQQQKAEKKVQQEKSAAKEPHKKNSSGNAGFAVPGAASGNAGFAVPGAPTGNAGFAGPGQATARPNVAQPAVSPIQPTKVQSIAAPVQQPATGQTPAPAVPPRQPEMQGQKMNFGETTNLSKGGYGETTVLNVAMLQPQRTMPYLLRIRNNEKIPLDKPVFRIGKERSYVDYFIGDNTAVSRSHANIITRDGGYSIVDTNSTNHTYVNGSMIQSNVEIELSDGARIRLGNEDFEFHLH